MNCCGWAINAQARPEEQAAAARYLLEWESWLHGSEGASQMIPADVLPGLITLFARPEEDHYCLRNIPVEWSARLETLRQLGRWEPEGADWRKFLLARTLASLLESGRNVTVDELRHNLALSEQEYGPNARSVFES
ncbi:MAG: hypothetical protein HY360_21110 [Verrucomicrobia bacterium]|nr:hypothetical protein [Verrucomicrobiota bacterium]